jgi:hypothetical protein
VKRKVFDKKKRKESGSVCVVETMCVGVTHFKIYIYIYIYKELF